MSLLDLKQRLVVNSLLLIAFIIGGNQPAAAGTGAHGWLAFGDLRGYLEPCGCDPEADQGGVKRIRALIENERLQSEPFDLYSLGNLLPPKDSNGEVKIPFLLHAVDEMKPHATLFNRLELAYWHSHAEHYYLKNLNFVLFNGDGLKSTDPFVRTQNAIVTGYLSPEKDKRLKPLDAGMLAAWGELKSKHPKHSMVLLFAGTSQDLAKITAADLFDTIIRSNDRSFSIDPDLKEKEDSSLLFDKESETWMVPLGGQGILRGGPMALSKAKTLTDIIGTKNTQCNNPLGFPGAATCVDDPKDLLPTPVSWLPRSIGGDQYYQEIFAEYATATAGEFAKIEARRAKLLSKSPFAGSAACESCHPKATAVWKSSRHATAMATLAKASKDKDWECVTCHAVGTKVDGGFASMETSPHLGNVQCENCHGPAKEHTMNPAIKPAGNARDCQSCHHEPHSSQFDFEKYWEKIRHAKESAMP